MFRFDVVSSLTSFPSVGVSGRETWLLGCLLFDERLLPRLTSSVVKVVATKSHTDDDAWTTDRACATGLLKMIAVPLGLWYPAARCGWWIVLRFKRP
jgi:hypothetical protein